MADARQIACPSCGAALAESTQCPSCGFSLEGKSLFDPRHFHWLGVLFSGLVPITMSAANWGRVGRTRERTLWLVLGFIGFALLFTLLRSLPRNAAALGFGVSAGLSYFLRGQQQPLFEAGLRLGAKRSSAWKGILVGAGLTIGALAAALLGYTGIYSIRSEQGARLMDQSRFHEAAAVFESLAREDPGDPAPLFALSVCRLFEHRWDDADRGLRLVLGMGDVDSAMVFGNLAIVEAARGRDAQADSLAARARAIQPAIFADMFGLDDVGAIADSITQRVWYAP